MSKHAGHGHPSGGEREGSALSAVPKDPAVEPVSIVAMGDVPHDVFVDPGGRIPSVTARETPHVTATTWFVLTAEDAGTSEWTDIGHANGVVSMTRWTGACAQPLRAT